MENKLKLGLKGSADPRQIVDRLSQNGIAVYEFHLKEEDLFGEKRKNLEFWIGKMRENDIAVYLHHPQSINGTMLHVNGTDSIMACFFELSTRILVELCETYDCHTVVHWNYGVAGKDEHQEVVETTNPDETELRRTLQRAQDIDKRIGKGRILWENGCQGVGAFRKGFAWAKLLADTELNLTFDVSHAFISLGGDNLALQETMRLLDANIQYLHVVDSEGECHDSLPVGKGKIDFLPLIPSIKKRNYIYEIELADYRCCEEMLESHRAFQTLLAQA